MSQESSCQKLISFARDANSDKKMGFLIYQEWKLDLEQWNEAIGRAGIDDPIQNTDLEDDFNPMKDQVKFLVTGIFRDIAVSQNKPELYVENLKSFKEWSMPESWLTLYWEITPVRFIEELVQWLRNHSVSESILHIVKKAENIQQLGEFLKKLVSGIEKTEEEISLQNRRKFIQEIKDSRGILYTYFSNSTQDNNSASRFLNVFSDTDEIILDGIIKNLPTGSLEIEIWSIEKIIQAILGSKILSEYQIYFTDDWRNIKSSQDLMKSLNISPNELIDPKNEIENKREQSIKQRRIIKIKGIDFDTDESNLGNIFEIVDAELVKETLQVGSIETSVILKDRPSEIKAGPTKVPDVNRELGKGPGRISKTKEAAIGAVGEYLVYNKLKSTYGEMVTPNS